MQYLVTHKTRSLVGLLYRLFSLTNGWIKVGNDGCKRNNEQLQVLAPHSPILRIQRRIGWLWPQHFRSIFRQLQSSSNGGTKLYLGFSRSVKTISLWDLNSSGGQIYAGSIIKRPACCSWNEYRSISEASSWLSFFSMDMLDKLRTGYGMTRVPNAYEGTRTYTVDLYTRTTVSYDDTGIGMIWLYYACRVRISYQISKDCIVLE